MTTRTRASHVDLVRQISLGKLHLRMGRDLGLADETGHPRRNDNHDWLTYEKLENA